MHKGPQEYETYIGMINREAAKRVPYGHQDYEDYVQQGSLAYVLAINSWDASKNASFTTHLYWCIQHEMHHLAQKREKWSRIRPASATALITLISTDNPEREIILKDILEKLSTETRDIINMLLQTPMELGEMRIKNPQITKNTIRKYIKSKGIKEHKFLRILKELTTTINIIETA